MAALLGYQKIPASWETKQPRFIYALEELSSVIFDMGIAWIRGVLSACLYVLHAVVSVEDIDELMKGPMKTGLVKL